MPWMAPVKRCPSDKGLFEARIADVVLPFRPGVISVWSFQTTSRGCSLIVDRQVRSGPVAVRSTSLGSWTSLPPRFSRELTTATPSLPIREARGERGNCFAVHRGRARETTASQPRLRGMLRRVAKMPARKRAERQFGRAGHSLGRMEGRGGPEGRARYARAGPRRTVTLECH